MNETRRTLKACIKQQRNKLPGAKKRIGINLDDPSLKSVGILVSLFVIFFILTHFVPVPAFLCFNNINLADRLNYLESAHYQNLIAILAGIGAIIFALVIFIAESSRDDVTKDKARVLLKESLLFPLTVAEILTFFLFIWGSVNFYIVIPLSLIGSLTILSVFRLIKVLLNNNVFAHKRTTLLKGRLRKCINEAIDERIGNNILLAELNDTDIRLEYNIFEKDRDLEFYPFKADRTGIVDDIHLDRLKKIADLIEKEARRNDFSFIHREESEDTPLNYGIDLDIRTEVAKRKEKRFNTNRRRYLLKKYHDQVTVDKNVLISVDRKLLKGNKASITKIDDLVKKTFTIKPINTYSDEVKRELSGLKDQCMVSIINRQTGLIDEFTSLYISLAEAFLEAVTEFGGGYSSVQALKERHALLGGWEEIRWLKEHIFELISTAVQTHDRGTYRKVAYLPFAIVIRAIKKGDHFLFQEFLPFANYFYALAKQSNDDETKKYLYEHSWEYLKEIAGFIIEPELLEENDQDKLDNLAEYAVYFFMVFQDLLKNCIDDQNGQLFDIYKNAVAGLFGSIKPTEAAQDAEELDWRLSHVENDNEERRRLESELKRKRKIQSVGENIRQRKYQMLFGLTSWLAYKVKNDNNNDIQRMYASIQAVFSADIIDFTDIFISAHDFRVEDYWGWGRWDIALDGGFHFINTQGKLELFYIAKGLSILGDNTDDEISRKRLPHSRDFAFLSEEGKEFNKLLDEVAQEPDSWRVLLTERAYTKVEVFRKLLNAAREDQEQADLELKRKTPISTEKTAEFINELMKTFYEHAGVRSLLIKLGLYEDRISENVVDDKSRYGISIVDDKAVFFKDWHVHYGGWGEQYGRTMAQGESGHMIDEIRKACLPISDIDSALKNIVSPEDFIIIASNAMDWVHKYARRERKAKNEKEFCRTVYGEHEIPVCLVYSQGREEKILLLSKTNIGKLKQKSPLNAGENKDNIRNIFYISIRAFSDDEGLIDEFLGRSIDWLIAIGDKDMQKKHLCERVFVQIYERYQLEISKSFEGYCLVPKVESNS